MNLTLHTQQDLPELLQVVQQQESAGLVDTTYLAEYEGLRYTRRVLKLGEELSIAHTTIDTERELVLLSDHPHTGLEMHFNLTGTSQGVFEGKSVVLTGAQHNQVFFTGFKNTVHYAPNRRFSCVEIDSRSLPALRDRLAYQPEELKAHLARAETGHTFALGAARPLTPMQRQLLAELLPNTPASPYRRLYLEARVWELYALQTEQFMSEPPAPIAMSPAERDKMHYIKEILADSLANPPSLLALSRLAGINLDKLKRGFKSLFGTTVYGHLHQLRMAQAQQLIVTGTLPLADVATLVGYKNPQHFTAAFKKYFGCLPSTLRQ